MKDKPARPTPLHARHICNPTAATTTTTSTCVIVLLVVVLLVVVVLVVKLGVVVDDARLLELPQLRAVLQTPRKLVPVCVEANEVVVWVRVIGFIPLLEPVVTSTTGHYCSCVPAVV